MFYKATNTYLLISTLLLLGGCAASGNVTQEVDNPRTYQAAYNHVLNVVGEAITSSRLSVAYSRELDDGTYQVGYVRDKNLGGNKVAETPGSILITRVDENHTRVEITRPEYPRSVPRSYQEDFTSTLFSRLEKRLGISQ